MSVESERFASARRICGGTNFAITFSALHNFRVAHDLHGISFQCVAERIEPIGIHLQLIRAAILSGCDLMLLIGIFVLDRCDLVLLIRQVLLGLSEIEAIGRFFEKRFGRFLKSHFFNLHLSHAG